MYSYVVTSQNPTAVQHTLVCSFTTPNDRNLIIAKGNHLEIHTLCDTGLIAEIDLPIFGKITSLNCFRYNGINQDDLFILTEKKHFCVVSWDSIKKIFITKVTGTYLIL
jgi:DNA damage-binding protein 1